MQKKKSVVNFVMEVSLLYSYLSKDFDLFFKDFSTLL
jgi:hypothetical protein